MKKNGFTLVEMMTVVVILVLLGLLAIFSINGIVKHSSDELYELQIANVVDAARTYAIAKSSELSDNNQITLCDLKRAGLIDIDFVNPKTEEQFDESLIINVTKNSFRKYDVTFDAIQKKENYYCVLPGRAEDKVYVIFQEDSPYYAKIGDKYEEAEIKVELNLEAFKHLEENGYKLVCNITELKSEPKDDENFKENDIFRKVGNFSETYEISGKVECQKIPEKETGNNEKPVIPEKFNVKATRTVVIRNQEIIQDTIPPAISLYENIEGKCNFNQTQNRLITLLEGETKDFNYPCCVSTEGMCEVVDNFKKNSESGYYEIIYKASDASQNTTTEIVNVIVREKNKTLLGQVIVDTFDWTNVGVNLVIEPLYNGDVCNDFLYSFDNGNNWQTSNNYTVTANGTYKLGIKFNPNTCSSGVEDFLTYKVSNVDMDAPLLTDANILVKDSSGNIKTPESKYETIDDEVIEHKYYYTNSSVTLSEPFGAKDSLSGIGINGYTVLINDVVQDVSEVSLTDEGRYVVELKAVDRAGNESAKKEVAVIIIDKTAPVCKFDTCSTISNCRNNPVITGTNVTYDATNGRYKVSMNSSSELVDFALTCTDAYYENENDYSKDLTIVSEKFSVRNEISGSDVSTITSFRFVNSESSCENGICTRNYHYTIGVNVSTAATYNSDPIFLRILSDAIFDKAGNSNIKNNDSMSLAKSN